MNTSYDTLTITINADSKQANTSIKALYTNLRNLEETAKNLDDKRIVEVKKLLQGIAKIDFSNVSKGLQDVVNAFKAFQNKAFQKSLNGSGLTGALGGTANNSKPEDYIPNFTTIEEQLPAVIEGLKMSFKEGKEPLEQFSDSLTKLGLNAEQVKAIISAFRKEAKVFDGSQLSSVTEMLRGMGLNAEQVNAILGHLKTNTKELTSVFSYLGLNAEQIKAIFGAIKKENNVFSKEQFEQVSKVLEGMGYSAERVTQIMGSLKVQTEETNTEMANASKETAKESKEVSNLEKEVKKLDKSANKASVNGLKKLVNQFKNIMKYRIIRKIIQEIYKALSEGIKNVAQFDTGVQDSLSRLSSAFTFVKNSIGAMLAPLIQIVTPALEKVMMLVGELGNTFAEFFASVNGQDTFSKATYELKEWNKEAKKTQALGIDELNIINQDDNAGGFTTEQVNLGTKQNELANSLKETFAKIREAFAPVVKAFRDLVDKLLPAIARLLTPISKIIGMIADLISTLVEETYESANNSLLNVANALTAIFDVVASIMEALSPALQDIVKVVAHVINIINGTLGQTHKIIADIFNGLKPIIHAVATILKPIVEGIAWVLEKICGFIDWINNNIISKAWEEIKSWFTIGVDDRTKTRVNIRSFATGGFPEDGLFFANHNELVGQFANGQTAVANNDQITQGIYEAVRSAMREGGNPQEVVINLDGNELARVVTKRQKNFGADVVLGGNINWGK